jgi:hypothetical protein
MVVWLDQPLYPRFPCFHRVFELRERYSGELFSDQLALQVLQLRVWRLAPPSLGYTFDVTLLRWARFLSVETSAQLSALPLEDSVMAQAAHTLEHLSQDPEAARLAREREDSAKFYQIGIAMSREEGRQFGIA